MPTFQPRMAEYSRILVLEGRCNTGIHSVDVFGPGRGKNRKLGAEIRLSRCTKPVSVTIEVSRPHRFAVKERNDATDLRDLAGSAGTAQ